MRASSTTCLATFMVQGQEGSCSSIFFPHGPFLCRGRDTLLQQSVPQATSLLCRALKGARLQKTLMGVDAPAFAAAAALAVASAAASSLRLRVPSSAWMQFPWQPLSLWPSPSSRAARGTALASPWSWPRDSRPLGQVCAAHPAPPAGHPRPTARALRKSRRRGCISGAGATILRGGGGGGAD